MGKGFDSWVRDLSKAQAGVLDAQREALTIVMKAMEKRDDMIRSACHAGLSQAEVGRITGLTRARIHQIVGE